MIELIDESFGITCKTFLLGSLAIPTLPYLTLPYIVLKQSSELLWASLGMTKRSPSGQYTYATRKREEPRVPSKAEVRYTAQKALHEKKAVRSLPLGTVQSWQDHAAPIGAIGSTELADACATQIGERRGA